MKSLYNARKPWITAIVALILGPTIGMCYINRGWLACGYFIVIPLLLGIPFLGTHFDLFPAQSANTASTASITLWVLNIIGAAHCFKIAKQGSYVMPFKWYSRWYSLAGLIAFLLLAPLAIRLFYIEPFNAPGSSMSPTIRDGDYFLAQKLSYNSSRPARGDVIVFKINDISYVKRVIGLPNDTVEITESVIYINNIAIPREQIEDYPLKDERGSNTSNQFIETITDGKKIKILESVMNSDADNTPIYTVPNQQYFVLGDNRDNSLDSRHTDKFGFIPEENITGKAYVVIWNDVSLKLKWEEIE